MPRAAYISTEAIGDGQGAVIGALMYVGAGVLMGPVAAAGGTIAAILGAAALGGGTGGLIGTLLGKLLGDWHARRIAEQLDHGGLLLWVRSWNSGQESVAVQILERNCGRDVHVHTMSLLRRLRRCSDPVSIRRHLRTNNNPEY